MSTNNAALSLVIPADALLDHWQGHRRLTRRTIEAFPDDQLFTFSVGSMRPFGALAMEMISIAAPMLRGLVTREWDEFTHRGTASKHEVLRLWDNATEELDVLWPQIPPERFQKTVLAFGQYEGTVYSQILYAVDNEIHHRGQGYVYLRALGIEPPPFYERA